MSTDIEKVLIDTNVIIDVLSQRKPWFEDSKEVITLAFQSRIKAYVTANSITDIVYLLSKTYDKKTSQKITRNLLQALSIISITNTDIDKAFDLDQNDFEDALQAQCAMKTKIPLIITRNQKDFKNIDVIAISPKDYIAQI